MKKKKVLAFVMVFSLVISFFPVTGDVYAMERKLSLDSIIQEWTSCNGNREIDNDSRSRLVEKLIMNGYEAYLVTKDSYYEIEKRIQTSLKELRIEYGDNCVVILSSDNTVKSSAGSSFNYSYNGTTYKLRYLTVTAADNSSYTQSGSATLLRSSNRSVIDSFLNATISTVVGTASFYAGVVSTLIGLVSSNISTASTSESNLQATSAWTRVFTQIYNQSYGSWYSGSCVEYVSKYFQITGTYYDARTNSSKPMRTYSESAYVYSSNYNSTSWMNINAVMGYLGSSVIYNQTGTVYYKQDGYSRIIHAETF